MRLVLLLIAAVHSMPDGMWFQKDVQPASIAEMLLDKVENVDTERLCQMTCADNDQCTAISYSWPTCYLLADQNDGTTCALPLEVLTKHTGAFDRLNKTAEFGPDRCVVLYPDTDFMDQKGICRRISNGKMVIIRAVNETGARVTFDNEQGNMLEFDDNRQMWKISFEGTGFEQWLVAVSCASSTDACPCDLLPMMDNNRYDIVNGEYADSQGQAACADPTHELTYWCSKFQDGQDAGIVSANTAAKMRITCQAGIWLLSYRDDSDGWHVTNATCAPPQTPMTTRDPNDMMAAMGDDPCALEYYPEDTKGVDEDGKRVTFDNNLGNVLTFDSARNMWKLSYELTLFEKWLVAVSCVLAAKTIHEKT